MKTVKKNLSPIIVPATAARAVKNLIALFTAVIIAVSIFDKSKTYQFKIRAFKTVDGKKIYSDYSEAVSL